MTTTETRSLKAIMREVRNDWKRPYFGAVPYIQALSVLEKPSDMYFSDRAEDLILYFLSNASGWRGETARRIKAELKEMVK
jgi:hypothetical protein